MKYKKTTNDFMEMFDNANSTLETAQSNISTLSKTLKKQLEILQYSTDYISQKLNTLNKFTQGNNNKIVFADANIVAGLYSTYGVNITPHLLKTPINLTNYSTGANYIFKDNITVTVNGVEDDDFKDALKHDTISDKETFFKKYSDNDLYINISLQTGNMLSSIRMNTLEFYPVFDGSFDIESIDIYSPADSNNPAHAISNITNVGRTRYILDSKTKVSKISIHIKLKYKDEALDKYIFGLKHLYLLDADYSSGSYAIVKITKDEAMKYIYNTFRLESQNSTYNNVDLSTSDLDVQFYLDYDNGVLSREVTLSSETSLSYISNNSKTVYMRLPIYTVYTSVTPKIELDSEIPNSD